MLQANFWLDKYKAQKIIKEKKLIVAEDKKNYPPIV